MSIDLRRISGLDLDLDPAALDLRFGPDTLHPQAERRSSSAVAAMMRDEEAAGPDPLYTIYMDVCRRQDREALRQQGLLYGSVIYNHGAVGRERLRSQGHRHAEKPGTGLGYSEVFEFWTGRGSLFLQKECGPIVSRAYLVSVGPGDRVVLPSGWVHAIITEGHECLSFGAWCARANTFEYEGLRALGGPCYYFPAEGGFELNPRYAVVPPLQTIRAADLPCLDIPAGQPIYTSWLEEPGRFDFLPRPEVLGDIWADL